MSTINKNKRRVIGINAILFAALFGLISLNKEILRPAFQNKGWMNTLTGCFPNFIAAFIISLGAVSAVLIRKPKRSRVIVYSVSILVSIALIVEEFKPMWGASEHFDLYDIFASAVGSFLAIVTFEISLLIGNRWKSKQ